VAKFEFKYEEIVKKLYRHRWKDKYFGETTYALSYRWEKSKKASKHPSGYIKTASNMEADFISVRRSNYVEEFEIKMSRSDFLADFKKIEKHECLKNKLAVCNYFSYVCPEEIIQVKEVPSYAGLIWVKKRTGRYAKSLVLNVKKPPPKLHSRKITDELILKLLTSSMYKHRNRLF
jgi:hypothetical protein